MKVLVMGAGGRTGRAVVARAVEAGHEVTAFLHSGIAYDLPGVSVHSGEASDTATIDAAVAGQDAVIDTIGGKTPYRRTSLETDAAETIVASMQRHHVPRLIVTSSIGVGNSWRHAPLSIKLVVATFLRGSTRDKAGMEAAVRRSELDWVITRPATLTDTPSTDEVRVFTEPSPKAHSIDRGSLAAFLVAQLVDNQHLASAVTIATQ